MASDVIGKIVRFGLVGASGVVVNAGVFRLGLMAGLGHYSVVAQAIAIEASILSNYALNAKFTFRRSYSLSSLWQFNLASAGGAAVQLGIYALLLHGYDVKKFIADLLAIPFGTAITFGASYFWVFARRGGADVTDAAGSPASRQSTGDTRSRS